ncbi:tetratricopeptide repeat protein [Desulfovibrio gilichinskyi]|uniref:Tetratricopeptide repeat-containing protein n=1 Tax=Desulfovibrio gilichinskyi TaxID=1519643 RepID=A0A1X7CEA8_9BACT|nr:tetratricopeptide repeat protein [Desulfovibrio gilichinskyi]SME95184.1 Tetratricopeptide repeat-containing protein [Desulfovibrio gilichinskyi]
MKSVRIVATALTLVTMLCSCTSYMTGSYYLKNRKYDSCIDEMQRSFGEDPQDADAAYFLGRCYLAEGKAQKSLPAFKKAVRLEPDNAEYNLWLGINHWALADFENEFKSYNKVIEIEPDHTSATLYLGHSYFDRGKWTEAIACYDKVIKKDPYNPEALFNRAEAKWQIGEREELTEEWKKYLDYYPDGVRAMRAVLRLNSLGDFSYRNYLIGQRVLTLKTPEFKQGKSDMSYKSMSSTSVIAAIMDSNKDLKINVISFVKGDKALARMRSIEIRHQILAGHGDIDPKRILLSWFDVPDEVETSEGLKSIDETVLFITEAN